MWRRSERLVSVHRDGPRDAQIARLLEELLLVEVGAEGGQGRRRRSGSSRGLLRADHLVRDLARRSRVRGNWPGPWKPFTRRTWWPPGDTNRMVGSDCTS